MTHREYTGKRTTMGMSAAASFTSALPVSLPLACLCFWFFFSIFCTTEKMMWVSVASQNPVNSITDQNTSEIGIWKCNFSFFTFCGMLFLLCLVLYFWLVLYLSVNRTDSFRFSYCYKMRIIVSMSAGSELRQMHRKCEDMVNFKLCLCTCLHRYGDVA